MTHGYRVDATYNTNQNSKHVGSYKVRMAKVETPDFCYSGSNSNLAINNISSWTCISPSFQDAINDLLDYLGFPVDVFAKMTLGRMDGVFLKPIGTKMKNDDFTEYFLLGRRNLHGRFISDGDDLFND